MENFTLALDYYCFLKNNKFQQSTNIRMHLEYASDNSVTERNNLEI